MGIEQYQYALLSLLMVVATAVNTTSSNQSTSGSPSESFLATTTTPTPSHSLPLAVSTAVTSGTAGVLTNGPSTSTGSATTTATPKATNQPYNPIVLQDEIDSPWSYIEETSWADLSPSCRGLHQSPIALLSADAPTRIISGFETTFSDCGFTSTSRSYVSARLQQTFRIVPTPVSTAAASTNGSVSATTTAAAPSAINQTSTTQLAENSSADSSYSLPASTCRMLKADGSLWRLAYMTPHAKGEHTLAGTIYPMSIDFVFKSAGSVVPGRNGYVANATSINISSPYFSNKTTVVSFLLTDDATVASRVGLTSFIDEALQALPTNLSRPIEYHTSGASYDLLSNFSRSAFFVYGGSLAAPPCNEGVTWMVSPHLLLISSLSSSRLVSGSTIAFANNTGRSQRTIQPANGRRVLYFTASEGSAAPYYSSIATSSGPTTVGRSSLAAVLFLAILLLMGILH